MLLAEMLESTGGVVSGAALVVNDKSLEVAVLPAASVDVTRKWYVVEAVSPESAMLCAVVRVVPCEADEPYAVVVPNDTTPVASSFVVQVMVTALEEIPETAIAASEGALAGVVVPWF